VTPRKIAAFAVGPIGGALLGLITLPIITWFFSQEDVGRMAMFQVTIGFSTLLFSLGLDQAYVREFHEVDIKPALLKRAALPGLVLLVIMLVVIFSLGGSLAGWLFEMPNWHLSLLIATAMLATFISRFLSLVLRMNERALAFSMGQVLPKLLLLGIIGSYVVTGADKTLTNLVLANTSVLVLVCLIFGFNTRHEWIAGIASKLDVQHLKNMLRFGLPLIASGLAFWSLTAVDKLFLRNLSSFEQLGIYSVAVSFAAAASVLNAVFSTVWAPTVYKWVASGEDLGKIEKVRRYVLFFVVLLFSIAGLFSGLVVFILPDNYADVRWIVVACMGFPLFYLLSETTVVGIGITKKTNYALIAPLVALVVNIAGNAILIPDFGAAGAAASTNVAFGVFFVIRTEVSAYLWKMSSRRYLYVYSFICVSGSIAGAFAGPFLGEWLYVYWILVFLSLFYFFEDEVSEGGKWILIRLRAKRAF
jgi:O-antigen/teichoic acid export membrane protein